MNGASASSRLFDALLAADRDEAIGIVRVATVRLGVPITVCDVIGGALHEIGDHWHRGAINVADEHVASSIVVDCFAAIRDASTRDTARPTGRIACFAPEGELHHIPVLAATCLLETAGWSVLLLGADLPAEHVVAKALGWGADQACMALTTRASLKGAVDATRRFHASGLPLMIGGYAVADPLVAQELAGLNAHTCSDALPQWVDRISAAALSQTP